MNTITYALPKNSQAWHNALTDVAHLLPDDFHMDNLAQLPIFAVVVVVDSTVLPSVSDVDGIMQQWADTQPNWQMQIVHDDELAKAHADKIVTGMALTDVSVCRYLLVPTKGINMSAAKREAAAHIIDDQLTSHLRHHILQKTNAQLTFNNHVDVHILSASQMLNTPKLVCFDMDSTLIEQEVIVELAKVAGVAEKVSDITEQAMRGEIDFATSFTKRVALLEDLPLDVVGQIIQKNITFSQGAYALMRALRAKGCKTVLVSGGFEPFAQYVAQTLGMDEYYANPLLSADGKLTGYTDPNILDGKQKAAIVARSAERLGIDMKYVVCVGDGANDLPMMAISGMGIAYKAKPIVQAKADAAINITGLEGVLYALGYRFDKTDV